MVVEEVYLNIIVYVFMYILFLFFRNKFVKEGFWIFVYLSVSFFDLKVVFVFVFKIISYY